MTSNTPPSGDPGSSGAPKYSSDQSTISSHLDPSGKPSTPLSADEWARLNDVQRDEWWWSLTPEQRSAQNKQLTAQEQKDWNQYLWHEKFKWPEGVPHNMIGLMHTEEGKKAVNMALENSIVSNFGKFQAHERKVAKALKSSVEGGDPNEMYL